VERGGGGLTAEKKKKGVSLSPEEREALITSFVAGGIAVRFFFTREGGRKI